jgi:hypothetical protein
MYWIGLLIVHVSKILDGLVKYIQAVSEIHDGARHTLGIIFHDAHRQIESSNHWFRKGNNQILRNIWWYVICYKWNDEKCHQKVFSRHSFIQSNSI